MQKILRAIELLPGKETVTTSKPLKLTPNMGWVHIREESRVYIAWCG
jgi:hypothetical protein